MNLIEFNSIISSPGQIEKAHINELHQIIESYPYFQLAHFLHLNGLKKHHSFKYNDYLKKTAAYTTDRAVLFDYITINDLDIHPAPKQEQMMPEPETEEPAAASYEADDTSPEATLNIGAPLQFKRDESYSFREWLQLSEYAPIDREEDVVEKGQNDNRDKKDEPGKTRSQMDLIDRFIAENPKISPSLSDTYSDATLDSVTENDSLMTETLAHVYVEQKKYKKAITAFTILSLKYPEKSSFFALQIEAIKKLQEK